MLDDAKEIKAIDKSDMLGIVSKFSELVESGCGSAKSLDLKLKEGSYGIIFLGVGGSAIGGDMLRDWLGKKIPGGVRIERGFELSSPIDRNSLVICCSYSGNTKETLNMLDEAIRYKPKNLILISSGGELKKIAAMKKLPFIRLDKGMPPRTTLASVVAAAAVITESLGWTKKASSEILAASDSCNSFLRTNLSPKVPESKNLAKQLAHQIHGFIPAVIAPYSMESVARRWKTQMNENAKQHCFFGTFPELSHNEIVPWNRDTRSDGFVALFLEDSNLSRQVKDSFDKFERTVQKSVKTISLAQPGHSKIEMLLNHILIADYTSTYSAILSGLDPTPVDDIVAFKSQNK